jgi:hypothetical protein
MWSFGAPGTSRSQTRTWQEHRQVPTPRPRRWLNQAHLHLRELSTRSRYPPLREGAGDFPSTTRSRRRGRVVRVRGNLNCQTLGAGSDHTTAPMPGSGRGTAAKTARQLGRLLRRGVWSPRAGVAPTTSGPPATQTSFSEGEEGTHRNRKVPREGQRAGVRQRLTRHSGQHARQGTPHAARQRSALGPVRAHAWTAAAALRQANRMKG